jgi:DNA (cytosine-5)-methyltransferase 1
MFFEVARILKVKRPKLVFLENVKGLLNHNKGETFKVILQTLEELGYRTQWMVLNSKFFGVPQNRERVFIIGSLRGEPRPEILPFREVSSKANELYRYEEVSHTVHARLKADSNRTYIEGGRETQMIQEDGDESFTLTKTDIHGVAIMDLYNKTEHTDRSPALTEPHHNTLRVREGLRIRRLTPTECERLQGFPDNWTEGFSDTQRYKMMGNAVTVNVIKAIFTSFTPNSQKDLNVNIRANGV